MEALEHRLLHHDAVGAAEGVDENTGPLGMMMKLLCAGVHAGVCPNVEDCGQANPQLRQVRRLTELTRTKVGA
jgi:hypothetical protein